MPSGVYVRTEEYRQVMKVVMNRPEVKRKIKGKRHSEEWNRKIGEGHKGKTHSEETRRRMSRTKKRNWQNPEYVKNQKEARNIKPNKAERFLMQILQSILPDEYKFVGDWSLPMGGKSPDFVNVNSQKKFIELFGDHWHDRNFFPQAETPQERIDFFKPYGYDTLVIWERELYDDVEKLKKRILKFHRKGALQKMFIGLKMRGQKILLGGKF